MRRTSPRTLGAEEEFHLVDLKTRRLTARAPELLAELTEDYVAELQRCVIETNTSVVDSLDALRDELGRRRRVLVQTAAELGIGVVAAGAVPLSVPAEMQVTKTERYRQMLADYQLLAREQLICGTQVHVGISDRDEAVAVGHRIVPYLPTLLAISASSPFASDGSDTGYSSMRTLVWQRWPTTGSAAPVESAEEYDELVNDLVASGVISDAGMVYFDVDRRTAPPTLELRVCDSCPSVDTVVLIAGLFRALVEREIEALRAGAPPTIVVPGAGPRGAVAGRPVGAGGRSGRHQHSGRPGRRPTWSPSWSIRCARNWSTAATGKPSANCPAALIAGTSSARQRRALRRRGRLTDVVDQLIAETAGRRAAPAVAVGGVPTLLFGYQPGSDPAAVARGDLDAGYDEAVDAEGRPRQHYRTVLDTIAGLGVAQLRSREAEIEQEQRADNVTFRVTGQSRAQLFPIDLVPRVVTAAEWVHLSDGLAQRARALDAFLRDIYAEQAIVAGGIIDVQALDRAPGFRSTGRVAGNTVRAHISGTDLVCDRAGHWLVLEDNLRVPSGAAYAIVNRRLLRQDPSRAATARRDRGRRPGTGDAARDAARGGAAAQPRRSHAWCCCPPGGKTRPGSSTRSWPRRWASRWCSRRTCRCATESCGATSVPASDASMSSTREWMRTCCCPPPDTRAPRCGGDCSARSREGNLTIANALANGVADDKAIYAYVPAMIEYLPRRKTEAGPDPDLDLRRARPARLRAGQPRRHGREAYRRVRRKRGADRAGSLRRRVGGATARVGHPAGAVHRPGAGRAVHPPHLRR